MALMGRGCEPVDRIEAYSPIASGMKGRDVSIVVTKRPFLWGWAQAE